MSGQDRDLDGAALLGLWALARTAGSTAQMAADQRHALYRHRAPYLDPASGRVAGDVLVTGVDVERYGWPSPCHFTKAGSCRWSGARQAYVPWSEPTPRVWGGYRTWVSGILGVAGIYGLLFAMFGGDGRALAVLVALVAALWLFAASVTKRDYQAANAQDQQRDQERWQQAEQRGHRPARPDGQEGVPAAEASTPGRLSYTDFLAFLHSLIEARVRLVFNTPTELGNLAGGFALGYLRGAVESAEHADTTLVSLTTILGGHTSCGGFLVSESMFESACSLPNGGVLVQVAGLAVTIVPESLS